MADKMMDRISKILNQAERAPEGSPEREAFMEKASVLSQAHSIDLAIARAHQAKKERVEEPERREHQVADTSYKKGASGKYRSTVKQNEHMVDLFLAIAHAYDLRCTINGSRTAVFAVGFPSDHEMAERMFSLLAVQMVTEADAALKAGANKTTVRDIKRKRVPLAEEDRDWGGFDTKGQQYDLAPGEPADRADAHRIVDGWVDIENAEHPPPSFRLEDVYDDEGNPVWVDKQVSTVDARLWRVNCYQGFISKISQRLIAEKRQAMREAGIDPGRMDEGKGLALVDKQKAVEDAYEEEVRTVLANSGRSSLGSYGGAEVARVDHSAHFKGQELAAQATTGNERDLRQG